MATKKQSANLYKRLLLPLPIIAGVAILLVYLITPNIVENIVRNNALDNAANLLANLRAAQDYYAKNVVKKALSIPGVKVSHIHLGVDDTLPIPATFLLEMTQNRAASKSKIRVVSPFPFKNRRDRKLDEFQIEAWDQLAVDTSDQRVILNRSAERSTFRIADAFPLTSEVCVACHNAHPDSPKNDWQVGDLRGVIDMEIDVTEQFARGEVLSQLIIGFFVITTIVYVLINYITARAVVSPITQITNAFRSYIGGEKDIELPLHGSQEVQHLSDAFAAFRESDDERQRLVRELEKKAFIDAVTGLHNREGFLHRLSQLTESGLKDKTKIAAVAIFDLDHFQDVNNTSGHAVGDQLIAALAERLLAEFSQNVEFARLGSDEFGAIFDDIAEQDVPYLRTLIEDIRRQIGMPIEFCGTKYKVTVSVGSAMFPRDGSDVRVLMTATDIALNHAKKNGRDQYISYSRELSENVVNRIEINTSIRDALGHDQFVPFYQAQLDLKTGEVIGAEALVRWLKADGSIVPPGVFLPVAEQSKLIAEIGAEVLYKSCQQIIDWEKAGVYLKRIAVNLSAVQLADPALLFYVKNALQQTGLAPERLELEITESAVLGDIAQVIERLQQLRSLGVELAIDDFGTGYCSLSYLKDLPVDRMKVDRAFVANIETDKTSQSILRSIISLGQAMSLKVLAEGVEIEEQANILRSMGCHEVQGFFYAKPVNAQDFETWFHRRQSLQLGKTIEQ